jgi:ABC-type transport system substrate-binding protein
VRTSLSYNPQDKEINNVTVRYFLNYAISDYDSKELSNINKSHEKQSFSGS